MGRGEKQTVTLENSGPICKTRMCRFLRRRRGSILDGGLWQECYVCIGLARSRRLVGGLYVFLLDIGE